MMKKNDLQGSNENTVKVIVDSSGKELTNPLKMVQTSTPTPKVLIHMLGEFDSHRDKSNSEEFKDD